MATPRWLKIKAEVAFQRQLDEEPESDRTMLLAKLCDKLNARCRAVTSTGQQCQHTADWRGRACGIRSHQEQLRKAPASPTTPQPSEPRGTLPWPQYGPNDVPPLVITPVRLDPKGSPGTTPEELATILEDLERETGEATRDQWDQDD